MELSCISVTESGDKIAHKLAQNIHLDLFYRKDVTEIGLKNIMKKVYEKNPKGIIFISSTGIAVRAIAPYIKSKDKDFAVVVVDSSAKFCISLLSGHLGGANELTFKVSNILNAEPIITTATDNLNIIAPDIIAKQNNLVIDSLKICKTIASLLVDNKKIAIIDDENKIKITKGYTKNLYESEGVVLVTNKKTTKEFSKKPVLKLIRKNIIIGIGCRKNYDSKKMFSIISEKLCDLNLDYRAVKKIATVEIKQNEKAIIDLSQKLNAELCIFKISEIKNVQDKYEGSDFVEKTIGVRCVCEPCAELAGAKKFLTHKLKIEGMTCAIGIEL